MVRKIALLASVAALGMPALAFALSSGTYSGESTLHLGGATAKHPFSLTVTQGSVTSLGLFAGATCTDLDLTSGVHVSPGKGKIKHDKFKVTLHSGKSVINVSGKFSGSQVSGSFSGTANTGTAGCSIPKNTFSATASA